MATKKIPWNPLLDMDETDNPDATAQEIEKLAAELALQEGKEVCYQLSRNSVVSYMSLADAEILIGKHYDEVLEEINEIEEKRSELLMLRAEKRRLRELLNLGAKPPKAEAKKGR